MFTKQRSDYNLAAHVGSPSGIKAIDQYKLVYGSLLVYGHSLMSLVIMIYSLL